MPYSNEEFPLSREEKHGIIQSRIKNIEMQKFHTELSILEETALENTDEIASLNEQLLVLAQRRQVLLSEASKYGE